MHNGLRLHQSSAQRYMTRRTGQILSPYTLAAGTSGPLRLRLFCGRHVTAKLGALTFLSFRPVCR